MGPLLLNYLVRAQQDRWGYLKTERLGGLAVQDHLELGRKLHREIARLLAQLPSTLCQRERRYFAESPLPFRPVGLVERVFEAKSQSRGALQVLLISRLDEAKARCSADRAAPET